MIFYSKTKKKKKKNHINYIKIREARINLLLLCYFIKFLSVDYVLNGLANNNANATTKP